MEALTKAAEAAEAAAREEEETINDIILEDHSSNESEEENDEEGPVEDEEVSEAVIVEDDDDQLVFGEAKIVRPKYELVENCLTLWDENRLVQLNNSCCSASSCLMKNCGVSKGSSSRCVACGFTSHFSCQVSLKGSTRKICRSCGKITTTGRRIEVEASDELEELISKNKVDMKLTFASKVDFNKLCIAIEDGINDDHFGDSDTSDEDGKLLIE